MIYKRFLREASWELIGLKSKTQLKTMLRSWFFVTEYDHAVALQLLAQKVLSWEVSEICRMLLFLIPKAPKQQEEKVPSQRTFMRFWQGAKLTNMRYTAPSCSFSMTHGLRLLSHATCNHVKFNHKALVYITLHGILNGILRFHSLNLAA